MPTKSRSAISVEQKKALRAYKRDNPTISNIAIGKWFKTTFQRPIALSSVSEILSKRYAFLDGQHHRQLAQQRKRREDWPELENALFQWIQRAEQHITITSATIREKAEFFWRNLADYKDQEMPTFSNGWLQGFQQRRGIKSYKQYGELASAASAEDEMNCVRQALASFRPQDIFNCYETGLFWKLTPDRSLSTRSLPGRCKQKARITIKFCTNSDGSEKLPLWVIGRAARPRAFQAARVNLQALDIHWRSNRTAWMTADIMSEWLYWFDQRMNGRKVVLLMDNFSAHEAVVELIKNSHVLLQNTLIIWLPPNTTSKYQPLNQGIINTWKVYWRKEWVRYMLWEYEAGRDPLATVDILKALRWVTKAWEFDITASVITNCFPKGLYNSSDQVDTNAVRQDISRDIQRLPIGDVMDISQFLNPTDEEVADT